jgi:hypothetical protein
VSGKSTRALTNERALTSSKPVLCCSSDLLLVEKVSSKVGAKPKRGEIVLFSPPPRLKEVVAATGGRVGGRHLFATVLSTVICKRLH